MFTTTLGGLDTDGIFEAELGENFCNVALFLQLYFIFMGVAFAHWLKEVGEGKVSSNKIALVFFVQAMLILLIAILPFPISEILDLMFVTISCLLLIQVITLLKDGFGSVEEETKVWVRTMMMSVIGTGLLTLLMDYPNTKLELQSSIIGIFSGSLWWIYPRVMETLNSRKNKGNGI